MNPSPTQATPPTTRNAHAMPFAPRHEAPRVQAVEASGDDEVLPAIPRPARDCCQSGCYGCEWGDAMRAHGLI